MTQEAQQVDTLPMGRCDACARDVLTHVEVVDHRTVMRRCLRCDQPIAATHLTPVADLPAFGYAVIEPTDSWCSRGSCAFSPGATSPHP